VTSQLPVAHWHEALGDPTIADAILDRLVHSAYRLELRGESLRRAQRPAARTGGPAGGSEEPIAPEPAATEAPGRPRRGRADPGHPTPASGSAGSAAMPDYPQTDERR
jgi:hypothetical protein